MLGRGLLYGQGEPGGHRADAEGELEKADCVVGTGRILYYLAYCQVFGENYLAFYCLMCYVSEIM